jgi:acetyl esterase
MVMASPLRVRLPQSAASFFRSRALPRASAHAPHSLAHGPRLVDPLHAAERVALFALRRLSGWAEWSAPIQTLLARGRIQILRDIPYLGSGQRAHLLDVLRPHGASSDHRLPAVLYVHGGGFEICSKETHWMMAAAFARAGHAVFNVNYRLAPEHPFPSGLQDVCAAYLWLLDNAERFGADSRHIIVAGESAGANLVTSLALCASMERPEAWARAVFRRNRPPASVLAACGLFEVSNPRRFRRLASRSWPLTKQAIEQIARSYLPRASVHASEYDLANPLRLLESSEVLARPLPPFLISCGTGDPLLHDSQRLARALSERGVAHEARYYPGEIHAFHAMWWRAASRALWRDTWAFLERRARAREPVTTAAA